MGNCSGIGNTQSVTLSAGTLTSGFCHTSLQTTYDEFIARTTAQLAGNVATFTAGDDTPAAGDQGKVWLKQDANTCEALGWYYYNGTNTAWEAVPNPNGPPVGSVSQYAGSSAPTGWLLCDGDAVSRDTYSDLFTIISTTYGTGNGSTTFNVPNLKGKVPVGLDSSDTSFDALAEAGGAKTHTLVANEIPDHTHDVTVGPFSYNYTAQGSNFEGAPGSGDHPEKTFTTDNGTGGGAAHENMPPYIVMNYIIKADL